MLTSFSTNCGIFTPLLVLLRETIPTLCLKELLLTDYHRNNSGAQREKTNVDTLVGKSLRIAVKGVRFASIKGQ